MSIFRPQTEHRSRPWALLRRFEIPDLDSPLDTYLTRYIIVRTPLFAIYVHRMDAPDSRTVLHDHPWDFLSIVLRGGYYEITDGRDQPGWKVYRKKIRHTNFKLATDSHYIMSLLRKPTWTLVLTGPRRREWGYWCRFESTADVQWVRFDQHPTIAKEFDQAMQARRNSKESS